MISVNDFYGEYELMGWIVEWRYEKPWHKMPQWERAWGNKIYSTEDIAKESVKHRGSYFSKQEFRYRRVYAKKENNETINNTSL